MATLEKTDAEIILDEKRRVHALRQLNVLDSQYEALYDSITALAAKITNMPIAIITLLDEDRIWFKSVVGLTGVTQTPRKSRYCDWVVTQNEYLEIEDISKDPLHCQHPLVNGETKFMFYAGAPITLPLGEVIGVLCVFDKMPNKLNEMQRDILIGLANVISKALVTKSFSEKTL